MAQRGERDRGREGGSALPNSAEATDRPTAGQKECARASDDLRLTPYVKQHG